MDNDKAYCVMHQKIPWDAMYILVPYRYVGLMCNLQIEACLPERNFPVLDL